MRKEQSTKTIQAMAPEERIELARKKIGVLYTCVVECGQSQANLDHLMFGRRLHRQIRDQAAAIAFRSLCDDLNYYSLLRLCALWDDIDLEKETIPTVAFLLRDRIVRRILKDYKLQSVNFRPGLFSSLVPSDYLQRILRETRIRRLQEFDASWRSWLSCYGRAISGSSLKEIQNARHHFIAHNIHYKFYEAQDGAGLALPTYGDPARLWKQTARIVFNMCYCMENHRVRVEEIKNRSGRNAEILWSRCRFDFSFDPI